METKICYTAPEATVEEINVDDVVLISILDETVNLDETSVDFSDHANW